jgi:hypothetical protein
LEVVVRNRAGTIWSVSMLVDGMTTVRERMVVIGFMSGAQAFKN